MLVHGTAMGTHVSMIRQLVHGKAQTGVPADPELGTSCVVEVC